MEKKDGLFAIYIFQPCCSNGSHFMFVQKIIHRSPGNHGKIIYMVFFVLPTSLTKHESCSAWKTWDNKSGPAFVIHLQSISRLHGSYDDNLDICFLKLENANACVDTNFLLGNWISAKYIVMQCSRKINTFKPSIFLFFPKAVY